MMFNENKKYYTKENGKWQLVKTEDHAVTTAQRWQAVAKDTLQFMRNLGGKETVRNNGYTSISPDGQRKVVTTYTVITEGGR